MKTILALFVSLLATASYVVAQEGKTTHDDPVGGENGSVHLFTSIRLGLPSQLPNELRQHTHALPHQIRVFNADRVIKFNLNAGEKLVFHFSKEGPADFEIELQTPAAATPPPGNGSLGPATSWIIRTLSFALPPPMFIGTERERVVHGVRMRKLTAPGIEIDLDDCAKFVIDAWELDEKGEPRIKEGPAPSGPCEARL